jgi:excisionase family DNA binding protein
VITKTIIGAKMKNKSISKQPNIESYQQQQPRPLNTTEASQYLGLSKSYFYKLTSRNLIASYCPMGKKLYFLKSDLDAYALRNRSKPNYELEQQAIDYIMYGDTK